MTLWWSRTILNPPLDLPYSGEIGMVDYPWITQVINKSRMFPKIYDTLVVRSVNKAKTKCTFLPQPTPPPFSALEGEGRGGGKRGGGISSQPPNLIGLSGYVKLFGVQGILGM